MERAAHRVWRSEDGYLVRGAHGEQDARDLLVTELMRDERAETMDEAREMAARMPVERHGWFRCNPCKCGDGHDFHLGHTSGPGPGSFRAVLFGW